MLELTAEPEEHTGHRPQAAPSTRYQAKPSPTTRARATCIALAQKARNSRLILPPATSLQPTPNTVAQGLRTPELVFLHSSGTGTNHRPEVHIRQGLHPPDVLLQVRAAGGQRVQAAVSAPSQVAAQVGLGVLAGGAREPGQVGGCGQPYMISWQRIGCGRGEVERLVVAHHAPAMRPVPKRARASIRLRVAFMSVAPAAQGGR